MGQQVDVLAAHGVQLGHQFGDLQADGILLDAAVVGLVDIGVLEGHGDLIQQVAVELLVLGVLLGGIHPARSLGQLLLGGAELGLQPGVDLLQLFVAGHVSGAKAGEVGLHDGAGFPILLVADLDIDGVGGGGLVSSEVGVDHPVGVGVQAELRGVGIPDLQHRLQDVVTHVEADGLGGRQFLGDARHHLAHGLHRDVPVGLDVPDVAALHQGGDGSGEVHLVGGDHPGLVVDVALQALPGGVVDVGLGVGPLEVGFELLQTLLSLGAVLSGAGVHEEAQGLEDCRGLGLEHRGDIQIGFAVDLVVEVLEQLLGNIPEKGYGRVAVVDGGGPLGRRGAAQGLVHRALVGLAGGQGAFQVVDAVDHGVEEVGLELADGLALGAGARLDQGVHSREAIGLHPVGHRDGGREVAQDLVPVDGVGAWHVGLVMVVGVNVYWGMIPNTLRT